MAASDAWSDETSQLLPLKFTFKLSLKTAGENICEEAQLFSPRVFNPFVIDESWQQSNWSRINQDLKIIANHRQVTIIFVGHRWSSFSLLPLFPGCESSQGKRRRNHVDGRLSNAIHHPQRTELGQATSSTSKSHESNKQSRINAVCALINWLRMMRMMQLIGYIGVLMMFISNWSSLLSAIMTMVIPRIVCH